MRVIISKNLFPQLEQCETEPAKYIIASYYEITSNYRTALNFKVKNYVHKTVNCVQFSLIYKLDTICIILGSESKIPGYVCIEDVGSVRCR